MAEGVDYPIHIYNKHQNFLTNFKYILSESKGQFPKLTANSIHLDPNTQSVTLNSHPLKLRKKEYELLKYLMLKKGNLVTKTELLENVWNYRYDIFTKTVDTHIHHLKKKINKNHQHIRTVYGQGYKLLDQSHS
jgi:DNA-binding response OmpR family regulator